MNYVHKTEANDTRPKRFRLIKNSEVIKVGDWISDASTGAENTDNGSKAVLGRATAIVTPERVSFESASVTTGSYGGTWVASTKQYTAAADNQTVDGIMVEYVPAREGTQFRATLSQAKGTTTGSNKEGYYLAVSASDSSKLDETTASATNSSTQFRIADPLLAGSTTEVIVEVVTRTSE